MSNSSTTSKSQGWISSGKHELCNSQENSTGNHNSILPTIYIHGLCYDCASYSNVHALSSYLLFIYLVSILRLACYIHVLWYHTLNPTLNFHHRCVHDVYTMRNHVPWHHSISKLFPILLDYSKLYDVILCDFLVMCHFSLIVD